MRCGAKKGVMMVHEPQAMTTRWQAMAIANKKQVPITTTVTSREVMVKNHQPPATTIPRHHHETSSASRFWALSEHSAVGATPGSAAAKAACGMLTVEAPEVTAAVCGG